MAEALKDETRIAPTIYLEPGYGPEDDGASPSWRVQYTPVPADRPPGLFDFSSIFAHSSAFVADATGEIIEHDIDDSFLSP